MKRKKFDLVVIGGGPAGYVAAIKASQLGLETACVDNQTSIDDKPSLGGTCLNVGCIPSKSLLDSSHHYEFISKHASSHGIDGKITIDISKMQQRKNQVVEQLTNGIEGLFKKNKVSWFKGKGRLASNTSVHIVGHDGKDQNISATNILISVGSLPTTLPTVPVDNKYIFDSSGAIHFKEVPEKLCIIGSGVIGLELGSVWRRLGSEVTMLEALPDFLTLADKDIANETKKIMVRQGLKINLNSIVKSCEVGNKQVSVMSIQNGKEIVSKFDKVIVAVGRRPNTADICLDNVNLELDEKGFIKVDNHFRALGNNVYAAGDCVGGAMLAHKASEEGIKIVEQIASGGESSINHANIPWIIYTWPEIAWVGKTEKECLANGEKIKIGKFPFLASGRSHAMGETEGFVKVIADSETDMIKGVHIIGANASELISEAVVAMEFGSSAEDLGRIVHGHPTLSESVHEAALAAYEKPIHF